MSGDVLARLGKVGVVPVVEIPDARHAPALAAALADGGVDVIEVTLRTPAALDAIRALCEARPDVLVGAGTIVSPAAAHEAAQAGARFAVSPGFHPELAAAAQGAGLSWLPGAVTAVEVQACLSAGWSVLKFFPAGVAGGPRALRALAAPFSPHGVRFVPTGGIGEDDLAAYLECPEVLAVGGSWLAPRADIAAADWDAIRARAARARALVDATRARVAGAPG